MPSVTPVNNYLVPATGTTNSVPVKGPFSATPTRIDFREVSLNGEQFVPSGVFIDNSAGAGPIVIAIEGMQGFTVTCAAGARTARQYPAPIDQIVEIIGDGEATVIFVDFPVIPSSDDTASSASAVTIADGSDVALGARADAPAANDTGVFSLISFIKRISGAITSMLGLATAPAVATVANWGITVVNQIVLPANANRRGAIFVNDGPNIVYLLLSELGPAQANTCSVILQAGGSFVLNNGDYTGNVHMVGAVAGGTLRVTEITP